MKEHILMMMAAMMAATILVGHGASGGAASTDASTAAPAEAATTAVETEAEATAAETEATTEAAQATGGETEILVAVTASLKNAYEEEPIPMFQGKHPGATVKGICDNSGKLQTQIEEGLEVDVPMSATTKQTTVLDEEGVITSDTITNPLENRVVPIIPTGSDSKLVKFEDIENAESTTLGGPASVPAGQYVEEVLTNLGIWDKVQNKVSLGTNVMGVLNQVAAASADVGIVYITDAASMVDKVEAVVGAPEDSPVKKVVYSVAAVKNTAHEEQAKNFVELLKTDEAMKVFEAYGFTKGEQANLTNLISSLLGWLP